MGGGSGVGAGAGTANSPPPFKANPMHIKYRAYTTRDDPNVDLKVRQCAKRLCRMSPHLSAVFSAARDRLEDLDARIARPDQSRRALSFLERGVLLPASPVVSPRARRLPRYFQNPLASQKTATQHLRDLENPPDKLTGQRQTPEIIEFLNICDYTHQVVSKVDVEEPLFQPFPPELGFHKYAPRKQYEQTLWFRNNDYVPRRIRIEDPRSRHFTVRRMRGKKGEKLREETEEVIQGGARDGGCVQGDLQPVDVEDYALDLVVATERERFIVPVRCRGNKPALDFPDALTFEPTPAKTWSYATRTVRNVGGKSAHFRSSHPSPSRRPPSRACSRLASACRSASGSNPTRAGCIRARWRWTWATAWIQSSWVCAARASSSQSGWQPARRRCSRRSFTRPPSARSRW